MSTKHEYQAKATPIEKNGTWNHQLIEVFDKKKKIGEYVRNYPTHGEKTFIPFVGEDGNWYALYSSNYTATRIMQLPSCKDIGGEPIDGYGFCPTHYYQPKIHKIKSKDESRKYEIYLDNNEIDGVKKEDIAGTKYLPIIFVSGCHWGDDSSWKIQAFDIRKAHKGTIERFSPIGYAELPDDVELSKAIIADYDSIDGMMTFKVKTMQRFYLEKDFVIENNQIANYLD